MLKLIIANDFFLCGRFNNDNFKIEVHVHLQYFQYINCERKKLTNLRLDATEFCDYKAPFSYLNKQRKIHKPNSS